MKHFTDDDRARLRSGSGAAHEVRREKQERLEINIVFTHPRGTLAALRAAGKLALDLDARLNLLVAQAVPVFFPVTRPPVAVQFTERRLVELASQGAQGTLETAIRLYLCRDQKQTLLQVLPSKSLVVIGGRKRWWWPTQEAQLARALQANGHQVIFVDGE